MKQRECIWRIQRQTPVLIASNVHYNVGVFFYFNLRIQIQYHLAKKKKKKKNPKNPLFFAAFALSAIEVILLVTQ